jgi:hypothetical protein
VSYASFSLRNLENTIAPPLVSSFCILLALGFGQNRGEGAQNGAHGLERFGFPGFLLWTLC